jgi:hypothetical protein
MKDPGTGSFVPPTAVTEVVDELAVRTAAALAIAFGSPKSG